MFHYKKSYSAIEPCSTSSLESKEENCPTSTNEGTSKTKQPAKHSPLLGFFYIFLASIFSTLTGVLVKKLPYINPGYLSLVRNAGVFAGCLPIAVYKVDEVLGPPKERLLLILRGLLSATAAYLLLIAFRYLPLAEAVIVRAIHPATTTAAARFSLKEPCGRLQVVSLVMSLCGVLLSVRLPELFSQTRDNTRFDSTYLAGLAAAVGCVASITFTYVALRKMKNLHFSVPMLYVGFFGVIENSIISFATSDVAYPRCVWDTILVMLIGIFGFFVQLFFTLALQVEAAGLIAVFKASLDI